MCIFTTTAYDTTETDDDVVAPLGRAPTSIELIAGRSISRPSFQYYPQYGPSPTVTLASRPCAAFPI